MGRPSKLSQTQWSDIERRLSEGETPSDLAREYGINVSQITRRFSQITQRVQEIAQKMADTEMELAKLPLREQSFAHSLAAKLRTTSENMAAGAALASMNFHRLHALANGQMQRVDDVDPFNAESGNALKGVVALTKAANECGAGVGILMNAGNKDAIKQAMSDKPDDSELTQDSLDEGAKRIAYVLRRAAALGSDPA